VWSIDRYELDAGVHKSRYELDVPSEAIELSYHQDSALQPAHRKRCLKLRPLDLLAALHLGEFREQLTRRAREELHNGSSLCIETQARPALSCCGHPKIRYKTTLHCGSPLCLAGHNERCGSRDSTGPRSRSKGGSMPTAIR
jgi:hypothetical protein